MATPTTDRGAMQAIIRTLRADGWTLDSVDDTGELIPVQTETAAVEAIEATGIGHLHVKRGDETGWVFFILGNDPDEVANDYTVNLTCVDKLVDEWIR